MKIQRHWPTLVGYVASFLVGGSLLCGYWWLVGHMIPASMVKVIFTNDPRMTEARKTMVSREIEFLREYFNDLGLDPPTSISPIQISNVAQTALIGSPNPDGFSILIGERLLDDKIAIRSAYSSYVFNRLLNVAGTSLAEEPNRWLSASFFAGYFANSYSDTAPTSGQWNRILWEVRQAVGKDFMDHSMVFSVKQFNDGVKDYKGDFDVFFKERLSRGLLTMDNPGPKQHAALDEAIRKKTPSP